MFFRKKLPKACQALLKLFQQKKTRYRRLELIGVGGLAEVSTYFDTYLNRVVAVKTLIPENVEHVLKLKGFIHEAKLISYLEHPGVVSLYDTFLNNDGHLCYTMKFIEGEDLATFLNRIYFEENHTALTLCLQTFMKIAETLAFVHDKGVLHLDLKPENIMIGRYGEVYLMDWGNARLYQKESYRKHLQQFLGNTTFETLEEKENFMAGTPEYMSPEQTLLTREELAPPSDIFSMGVIFYEMLSQKLPFIEEDTYALFEQIRHFQPLYPHEVNPNIPRKLSQICMKMLAKNVGERYHSFHEILAELKEFSTSGQGFLIQKYKAGEIIFTEGDSGEYAFVILSGLVEISKEINGERKILAHLGKEEIVGELAIFTKQPRMASAKALEPTTIKMISKVALEEEMEKLSPWLGQMINRLSTRFVTLNDRILHLEKEKEIANPPK